MEMNFCRRCGASLSHPDESLFTCANGHKLYVNPAPAVGVFFLAGDGDILLSVRGQEPYAGMLDSFGGFIDLGETAEQALARELQEELGLTEDQYDTPEFISTEIVTYPFDGEDREVLSTFFWSRLKPDATPVAADDVAAIERMPLAGVDFARMDNVDVRNAILKLQERFS